MSWRKRPRIIRQTLESVTIPLHLGMEGLTEEDRGELAPGVDSPTRLLTGDLSYT